MAREPEVSPEVRRAVTEVSSVWWVLLVVGIIFFGFGVVMLFNVAAGATVVAVIVGLFLIFDGIIEIATSGRGGSRTLGVILGLLLIAGGIISCVWPGVTFLVIALVWGITILVGGLARLIGAFAFRERNWGWLALLGAAEAIVGVLAIAWPNITAYVILLLIGLYAIVAGLLQIVLAFELKKAPERLDAI